MRTVSVCRERERKREREGEGERGGGERERRIGAYSEYICRCLPSSSF